MKERRQEIDRKNTTLFSESFDWTYGNFSSQNCFKWTCASMLIGDWLVTVENE